MKLLGRLARGEKIVTPVAEATAARVIYEAEELHRIEVTLKLPERGTLVLELRPQQAKQLATHLVAAYRAIGYEFKI